MKKLILIFVIFSASTVCLAQSIERDVVASSGDHYENQNISLSWTLGEIATETYSNGNIVLTQGFQQSYGLVIHGIDLDVLVYLEGPFEAGNMNTNLYNDGLIPLNQPYNVSPWFYAGTEGVASIPNNVVDWVLIDLRDATSASNASPGTSVEIQAAFILDNGSVVGLDGSSVLQFTASIINDPYVVVWHRNHLGVLSAFPAAESGGVYTYNFSTAISQAHGSGLGYKLIDSGMYGMAGGDVNGDGIINDTDKDLWAGQAGIKGYKNTDLDMNTQVNNNDKNDLLIENQELSSQVPE